MPLIKLYTGRDAMDAHHIRATLEDAGIRAAVMGETLGAARGELPMTAETLPAVWVESEDATRALEVVREYQAAAERADDVARRDAWKCACGQTIEGQFTSCWNCGAERPA